MYVSSFNSKIGRLWIGADDNFLLVEANMNAFKQVLVTDTALWGGDLWLVFLPHKTDADFFCIFLFYGTN